VSDSDALAFGLLLFRVAVGAIMLAHGVNHVFRGGRIPGTAGWFESLGMRPGVLHAWLASLTELGAGAMLVLGLLTPLAAAGVVGTMGVAWVTNHLRNGFFIFRPGEGWEYVMLLTVCGAVLGVVGAGDWSLDQQLDLFQPFPGADGLLLGAGLGVLSAGALLAVFWRPEKKPDTGS
jgi:putative oxidoreductase